MLTIKGKSLTSSLHYETNPNPKPVTQIYTSFGNHHFKTTVTTDSLFSIGTSLFLLSKTSLNHLRLFGFISQAVGCE